MYEEFYGLSSRPFKKTPDPNFLFMSRAHEEALARLQYAVEEKEMVLLTGDVGCGKTTLTRALMDSFEDRTRVALIINPRLSPVQFLRIVARRFGVDEKRKRKDILLDALYERVYEDFLSGITPVIIIDEAQLMTNRQTFEELRLLTNFQLDETNLICMILVGQTDLRSKIDRSAYSPLRQRIGMFYHLGPLGPEEVGGYVSFRLSVAGRDDALFTDRAIEALYKYSGGVPRIINSLADSAMIEGLGLGRTLIGEDLVEAASRELGLKGYGVN